MPIDGYKFRPITFQGVTFPATLMGISILDPVIENTDEELGLWLWQFPICCGVSRHANAGKCGKFARQTADLMIDQRLRVLEGIRQRLASRGFDTETTYRDWLSALENIAELSDAAEGDCVWSAPSHPRDSLKSEAEVQRFMNRLTGGD